MKRKAQIQQVIYALDRLHNDRPVRLSRKLWLNPKIGNSNQFQVVSKDVYDERVEKLKQEFSG